MALRPLMEYLKVPLNVTGLSTLAPSAKAFSDEISLAIINCTGLSIDTELTVATPENNIVDVYLEGTNDSGNYGSTDGIKNTNAFLKSVDMSETNPKVNIQLPFDALPPFFRFVYKSNLTNALTSATVTYTTKTVNNV